jgi:hypothetical protein
MKNTRIDAGMEQRIRDFFDENFETLQMEGGHSLSPEVKETALRQVLMYWRKLSEIATKVTDTEVKLALPEQTTPAGRPFGIEGVVDIVREGGRTVMYDVKTHDPDLIRANIGDYEDQLNVYAHIWQNLRGQPLDETAIICTMFPEDVKNALDGRDEARLARALDDWEPVIETPFDTRHVKKTIDHFGQIVDLIEEGCFAPAPVDRLEERTAGMRVPFAMNVCRNCDARFSCASYRSYAQTHTRSAAERSMRLYFSDLEDSGADEERDDRILASLEMQREAEELG